MRNKGREKRVRPSLFAALLLMALGNKNKATFSQYATFLIRLVMSHVTGVEIS